MIAEKFANVILVSDGDKDLRDMLLDEYHRYLEYSYHLDPQWLFVFMDYSAVWLEFSNYENILHVFENADDAIVHAMQYPKFVSLFGEDHASSTDCGN